MELVTRQGSSGGVIYPCLGASKSGFGKSCLMNETNKRPQPQRANFVVEFLEASKIHLKIGKVVGF